MKYSTVDIKSAYVLYSLLPVGDCVGMEAVGVENINKAII